MIEKVNPSHPDKVADRIAGAIVDYAYEIEKNPRIAVEVLLGHGKAFVIAETDTEIDQYVVEDIVERIAGKLELTYVQVWQDEKLASNQEESIKAGDNGIFKGVPTSSEVEKLSVFSRFMYAQFPTDGKYILANGEFTVCQSFATEPVLNKALEGHKLRSVNPLGYWTGGLDVDSGATNRKLGSDMGEAVTGGGLHGKDLSKADVSLNIYAYLKAQETGKEVMLSCAIGDEYVDGKPYSEIVEIARKYVKEIGGFEKLAEWGIV